MDTNYLNNKPSEFVRSVWLAVEETQDNDPRLNFGWYGFIPMVHESEGGWADGI